MIHEKRKEEGFFTLKKSRKDREREKLKWVLWLSIGNKLEVIDRHRVHGNVEDLLGFAKFRAIALILLCKLRMIVFQLKIIKMAGVFVLHFLFPNGHVLSSGYYNVRYIFVESRGSYN